MMPNDVFIEGINDSKLLNEEEREMLYEALVSHPKVQVSVTTMQCPPIAPCSGSVMSRTIS